jgi:hypothetical protein
VRPIAEGLLAAAPAPVKSMDRRPSDGVETSNVTVRATPSEKTMFTASRAVGKLAGFQLPGTFQLPSVAFQFLATAGATIGGDKKKAIAKPSWVWNKNAATTSLRTNGRPNLAMKWIMCFLCQS